MAYRFDLQERSGDGFHRIALEQIGSAERILLRSSKPHAAVHGARKSIKRTRSLLRLVRPLIGETTFHRENARLRGIAPGGTPMRRASICQFAQGVSKLDRSLFVG